MLVKYGKLSLSFTGVYVLCMLRKQKRVFPKMSNQVMFNQTEIVLMVTLNKFILKF